MIELTRLNEMKLVVNADIIETIEETPDTVVTLTTGKKIIVKENIEEIKLLVLHFKRNCFGEFTSR